MKLPRDVNGTDLENALRRLGYRATRQRGSHVRVTTQTNGEHHEVIPRHNPIGAKTLSSILPQPLRPLEEIRVDILALERETEGLLGEVIGSGPV